MAAKKRRTTKRAKGAASRRRPSATKTVRAKIGRAAKPKSTIRGQADSALTAVLKAAVAAGNRAAAFKAKREMERRSEWGVFDVDRFNVPQATLASWLFDRSKKRPR